MASPENFLFPTTGASAEANAVLLGIDDELLPCRKNLCLYLSKPEVRPEAVLGPGPGGTPDDRAAHFYGTVLHDNGKFRMWYYACHWGKNPDWPPRMMQQLAKVPNYFDFKECELQQGPLCYAESEDGIRWTKPVLNQVSFKGSTANNVLAFPHAVMGGCSVIRDDGDPDPGRRYKMVYQYFPDQSDPVIDEYGTAPTVALAVSGDGLRWNVVSIPFRNQFVEHCSFIKHQGQYMIHYHLMEDGIYSEGGARSGRTGVARLTGDFDRWPDVICETFALPEPHDPKKRGMSGAYDQVHLGVGAASFGNVCVGLYGLWHNADFKQAFHEISGDLGLLISNDGLHFREPAKGNVYIHRDQSPVTPVPGREFRTALCQGNGLLNVGDTTYIYHGRWRNTGMIETDLAFYWGEVALATLPRDRWGALGLNPGAKEGCVFSAPIRLPQSGRFRLALNAGAASSMKVEIANENFTPIPEYSGARHGVPVEADGLDCAVNWKADLSRLAGQTVRVRIAMEKKDEREPRLYAVYLAR